MSHMVIYRTGDGQPGYHQAEALDEAVKFVERLRNGDGVDSARIFRMEEVNFDFRPYFKVEIGPSGDPVRPPTVDGAPVPSVDPEPAPAPAAVPEPAPVADSPAPPTEAPTRDAWGNLGDDLEPEPTPLIEQAASFMGDADPDPDESASEENGHGEETDDRVGARRGLFGR